MGAKFGLDDVGYQFPLAACEPGAHAGHVNRGLVCEGELANSLESFADGFVADWGWVGITISDPGLADDVGDTEAWGYAHELDLSKGEWESLATSRPAPVGAFGLGPAPGEGFDETGVPEPTIVAAVGNDAVSTPSWVRGIAFDIGERHSGKPPCNMKSANAVSLNPGGVLVWGFGEAV